MGHSFDLVFGSGSSALSFYSYFSDSFEFRKNGYLLCAWRTNFMWKYPCVACVTDIFGARAGFSLWVLAMSFLSVCWPFSPCLKGWDWCGGQARILEWVAMPSSRGPYQSRDQIRISCSSCTAGRFFRATGETCLYVSANIKYMVKCFMSI